MSDTPKPFDVEAYNADVRKWGQAVLQELRSELAPMGSRSTGMLMRLLRVRFYQKHGEIYGLGFQFPRHGVYLEKGARKGYGGRKGSRWYNPNATVVKKDGSVKQGGWRKTDPRSLGKMGTGASPARPWLNPVVERRMDQLTAVLADHVAQVAINSILIR